MILTAIIPLIGVELTKKLSGRLLSSSGEVVKKEALTKSRLFVNKISKRLIKKEIFKKKISELKPDELKGIMENIFSTLGEEFNSSIGDLVQDVTDANNIIIEAIKNVEQQISQIDDFGNYVINSLKKEIRNGYISKDEFKEIFQTSVGDWFFDLEESIERLGSEQIERIKETISLELLSFNRILR